MRSARCLNLIDIDAVFENNKIVFSEKCRYATVND